MLVLLIILLLLLLLSGLLWAGGGKTVHEPQGSGIIEAIPGALTDASSPPAGMLVLLSYRLGYGLGPQWQSHAPADAAAVYDRLDQIIETIAASEADVALLQEVDFASQRTHDIDQLYYIAAALGWGFAARAITWECRYLPWPLRRPLGRLRAGMGVISRYPLVQNTRQRLSQPRGWLPLSPLFSPYHTIQMVDVQCGGQNLRLLNAYLESRAVPTRQQQGRELAAFARQVATPSSVLMGACNTPASSVCESGTHTAVPQDETLTMVTAALQNRFRVVTAAGSPSTVGAPRSWPAHTLIGTGLRALETRLLSAPTTASDHLPLVVHLHWALPLLTNNGRSHHERC